jgi:hypothetical protein
MSTTYCICFNTERLYGQFIRGSYVHVELNLGECILIGIGVRLLNMIYVLLLLVKYQL